MELESLTMDPMGHVITPTCTRHKVKFEKLAV